MNYYRLIDDLYEPIGRWFLGSTNFDKEGDIWRYLSSGDVPPQDKELSISIREQGISLDFTMADFELLIVNEKVLKLLNDEEVQAIPVIIQGVKLDHRFFILVIKKSIDCVDESNSVFDKWQIGNSIRPDKAGQYKLISKFTINQNSAKGHNIFRVKGYNVMIVVNEEFKNKFEINKITGVKFIKLS